MDTLMVVLTGLGGLIGMVYAVTGIVRDRLNAKRLLRPHECRKPRLEGLFLRPLMSIGDRWECGECGTLYEVHESELLRYEFSRHPVLDWKIVDEHQEHVDARQRELDAWQDEFDTIASAGAETKVN